HLQPPLHLPDDRSLDRTFALEGLLDLAPHLELLGLLPRQDDLAAIGVARLEVDVDLVTLMHGDLAVAGGELVDADLPFRLVPDVDGDRVASDVHDSTRDDFAG